MSDNKLSEQINAYSLAMTKYNQQPIYHGIELTVSSLVMLLQVISLFNLFATYHATNPLYLLLYFCIAYLVTDFVNGLVHMYMDNNTHYKSIVGPFVASFHLHHANPRYVDKHIIKIYFFESGTKFWLLLYLIVLCISQTKAHLPFGLNFVLVSVGILSSVAEVSHYLSHNATNNNKIIRCLQKYYFLLSIEHHAPHHIKDNINYAFLNGLTDPCINWISKRLYTGYKNDADLHTKAYVISKQT